jgi:hypothetical protein
MTLVKHNFGIPIWVVITEVQFLVDCAWNVMAHAQKPDLVFRRNGRVHLNRRGRQFIRLLAAEVCASVVVMLDTPCSEVVWKVLATHSTRQFPLHFPFRASPCAITFQLNATEGIVNVLQATLHQAMSLLHFIAPWTAHTHCSSSDVALHYPKLVLQTSYKVRLGIFTKNDKGSWKCHSTHNSHRRLHQCQC